MRILIVGAVAAGASAAARLRRLNEDAEIIMFDKGEFVSFSNCGLPYHISGKIPNIDNLILMSPEKFLGQYNIIARVNSEVVSVDGVNKTIKIKNTKTDEVSIEGFDKLVLAPGARAIMPRLEGIDKVQAFSLKTVTDLSKIMQVLDQEQTKNAVVIGGGFIGVEAAENLHEAGFNTTLIEGSDQIIRPIDRDMVGYLHNELRDHGVNLVLNDLVSHFDTNQVVLASGLVIDADVVIMAVGVTPDTDFLTGSNLEMTERGYIVTDERFKTSHDDIYAGGDAILIKNQITGATEALALAGPANKQGRYIADAIMGKTVVNNGYIGSSAIKVFDLNAASTGLNEDQVKKTGVNYDVCYAAPMDIVGIMPGATAVMIKLIYNNDNGEILGAQAISKGASDKRIDVIATAIKGKLSIYDLTDLELCYAPPFGTGKDVANKIGYIAVNLHEGLYKQVRFSEVHELLNSNAQVIDVREDGEYAASHLKGTKLLPMSTIRHQLDQLDKSKPVYVHCKTGQRSYNITLMLNSKGFDAYNIAGSFDFIVNYEKDMRAIDPNRLNIVE